MFNSKRRWVFAMAVGLYFYFLLPATAVLFYELYHLTGIGLVYWGYSAFKAGAYYLGVYPYRLLFCVVVALLVVAIPAVLQRLRTR